jgi:hypothetical protein
MTNEQNITNYEDDLFADTKKIHYFEVELGENKKYKFGIRPFSGYDVDAINDIAAEISMDRSRGDKGRLNLNQAEANVIQIQRALIEAPFPVTKENIKKLKNWVQEKILEEIKKLNSVDGEVVKN